MVNKECMANDMLPTRKAATLKISFPSITDDTAAHRKIFTTKTFCLLMQQSLNSPTIKTLMKYENIPSSREVDFII